MEPKQLGNGCKDSPATDNRPNVAIGRSGCSADIVQRNYSTDQLGEGVKDPQVVVTFVHLGLEDNNLSLNLLGFFVLNSWADLDGVITRYRLPDKRNHSCKHFF